MLLVMCNAVILLVSKLNYSCQFKRHYTLMVIVLIIFLTIKVSIGCELICLEKLGELLDCCVVFLL